MIIYELTRGLAYRKIRHPDMHWYVITLPVILTLIMIAAFASLPVRPAVIGKDALLSNCLAILSTLPGFYFAGLAAVATFNGMNMDSVMQAPAPQLEVRAASGNQTVNLSRRQFLSYIFSYLVLISFVLCVFIVAINAADPSIKFIKSGVLELNAGTIIWDTVRYFGIILFFGAVSSITVTTLHGVFFLTERIHQP